MVENVEKRRRRETTFRKLLSWNKGSCSLAGGVFVSLIS